MSCGCNPLGYDINRVAYWEKSKIYFSGQTVRTDVAIWEARVPSIYPNIARSPMVGQYWIKLPSENCYNPEACIIAPATSQAPQPTSVQPAVVIPDNQIFPTQPNVETTTLTPVIPIESTPPFNIADMLPELPEIPEIPDFQAMLPDLQNLPEIETKHIIIGIASVLTLILLFKK